MKASMCSLSCLTEVNEPVLERLALQDREPDLDLIEPGSTGRREVEMYVGMTLEPAVVFRLMGVEIVEDDMDGCIRISGGDLIHEVEELDASTAALVGSHDFTGRHFERGEQSRGAVPLVIVAVAGQRPAVEAAGTLVVRVARAPRCNQHRSHERPLRRRPPFTIGGRQHCRCHVRDLRNLHRPLVRQLGRCRLFPTDPPRRGVAHSPEYCQAAGVAGAVLTLLRRGSGY